MFEPNPKKRVLACYYTIDLDKKEENDEPPFSFSKNSFIEAFKPTYGIFFCKGAIIPSKNEKNVTIKLKKQITECIEKMQKSLDFYGYRIVSMFEKEDHMLFEFEPMYEIGKPRDITLSHEMRGLL